MISFLKGSIEKTGNDFVDIDVRGAGYRVYTSISTIQRLSGVSEEIKLYTMLFVREDALTLFGFLTEEELAVFEKLITVSGVGPKVAVAVLGTMSSASFCNAVFEGDAALLTTVPGIGAKTAQRIILELKDKLGGIILDYESGTVSQIKTEAVQALVALGFNRFKAEKALSDTDDTHMDTAQLIRLGLKRLRT